MLSNASSGGGTRRSCSGANEVWGEEAQPPLGIWDEAPQKLGINAFCAMVKAFS